MFLLGIPLLFSVPVMQHKTGTPPGFVLAAPHDGYDMYTGDMARRVSHKLGWATVIAKDYRDSKDKRWLDVNRPTQRIWSGTKKGKERTTSQGRSIFNEYLRRLRAAAQVSEGPIPLLIEFHGHNRRISIGTERVRLDVIECATRGFSADELKVLHARYERLAAARWPVGPHIQLRFDTIHERYVYRGKQVSFYYKASGSKAAGSLQASVSKRVLHFELPQNARSTRTQRSAFGQLFSDLLAPLAEPAPSAASGASGGATGALENPPGSD